MALNTNIEEAFLKRPDLINRTYSAITENVSLEPLFVDIAKYVQDIKSENGFQLPINSNGPASKKRKLGDSASWKVGTYMTIKDLPFSIPQRKKFTLEVGNLESQGLQTKNPASGEVEFAIDWGNIEHVICLPVPDKAQAQYNFCVFPVNNSGIGACSDGDSIVEQIMWTVLDTVPKLGILGAEINVNAEDTYKTVFLRLLNERLELFSKKVIQPNELEFTSQAGQAYKNGEKAVHVKAFRGNKDGFLFFLRTGIAWAFKKPLIFFSFPSIATISYTSVLQRTFNLTISVQQPQPPTTTEPQKATAEPQEFEFSMIDQAEFAGIDAYIRRHGLHDASMAEQRRARKLHVNGKEGGEDGGEEDGGEEGELQKAAREAQEQEDEEEEEKDDSFDPRSEGGSDGSGDDSSEGEGEGEGVEEDDGEGKDLVREELGSEAEDIEEEEGVRGV